MRRFSFILLAAAGLLVAPAASADDVEKYCAAEWPQDYRMQAHCVGRQREAARNYRSWAYENIPGLKELREPCTTVECLRAKKEGRQPTFEEIVGDLFKRGHRATVIMLQCSGEWPDDYTMKWHCIEQQQEALRQLGRPLDGYEGGSLPPPLLPMEGEPGSAERAVAEWRAKHLPVLDAALRSEDTDVTMEGLRDHMDGPEGKTPESELWGRCMKESKQADGSQDWPSQIRCLNAGQDATAEDTPDAAGER